MGRDEYTTALESYILGFEISFRNFKSGFTYQICDYNKMIKSFSLWSQVNFQINQINFNYDIFYKSSESYNNILDYDNDLLCTSTEISRPIWGNLSMWCGGIYINRFTSIALENYCIMLGITYNLASNKFKAGGGYGYPEAILLRWLGSLNQQYYF